MNENQRPILITGSNGFIGRELCRYLWDKSCAVVECNYDLNDIENIEKLFQANKPDVVIHLAAKLDKLSVKRPNDDFFQINVMGTLNIVRLCKKYGAKLIYFSSKQAQYASTKYGNKYGISKLMAENLIESFTINQGLKAVSIRPVTIYKTIDEPFKLSKTIDRFGKEEDITKGEWYPMSNLFILIESIIAEDKFEKYRVYKTKMLRHHLNYIKSKFNGLMSKMLRQS